jgi:hypothetical protein
MRKHVASSYIFEQKKEEKKEEKKEVVKDTTKGKKNKKVTIKKK